MKQFLKDDNHNDEDLARFTYIDDLKGLHTFLTASLNNYNNLQTDDMFDNYEKKNEFGADYIPMIYIFYIEGTANYKDHLEMPLIEETLTDHRSVFSS